MAVSGITATLLTAAGGGLIKLLFSWVQRRMEAKKWQSAYEAAGPQAPAALPAPPPLPRPTQKTGDRETPKVPAPSATDWEAQRLHVKHLLVETELAEAQQALRRLRKALDEATNELSTKTAELVVARSMLEEMNDAAEKLRRENEELRKEGMLNESRNHPNPLARHERRSGYLYDDLRPAPTAGARRPEKGGKGRD